MLYRLFGRTGLKVSAFSLGTWVTFDKRFRNQSEIVSCVSHGFDQGINLLDTAEVYGEGRAEAILGNVLKQIRMPRDKYMVCSKVFWGGKSLTQIGLHRKHIIEGCHQSLDRLGLSYLDFYLCHRPDLNTSIEETVIAMNILIQQGKIFYWGTSEWPAHLILEAYYVSKQMHLIPPTIEQFEYNLFSRERGEKIIPELMSKMNLASMGTMPLASGILAGRYNREIVLDSRAQLKNHTYMKEILTTDEGKIKIGKSKRLSLLADKLGVTQAQLSLAWCLLNKNINTIILGFSNLQQLTENLKAINIFEENKINDEVIRELESNFNNKPEPVFEPSYFQVIRAS